MTCWTGTGGDERGGGAVGREQAELNTGEC